MQWEANMIQALQSGMSNGFTDFLFKVITQLGDELFFMAVAMVFFWCISKRDGYKFINVYFVGCAVIEVGKSLFKRPRPFNAYESIHSIGEPSTSYSFPSGHSHSIGNMSTQMVMKYRKKGLSIVLPIAIVVTILVMFSRMFLGQHYLTDVLTGVTIGIAVAIGFSLLFELLKDKEEWLMLGVIPICIIVTIIALVAIEPESSEKILMVAGAYIAVALGYFIEKRYIKLEVKAKLWQHLLKILIGGGVAFGLYFGLKFVCSPQQSMFVYAFVRYFLIAIWAFVGAPFVFKLLKLYNTPTKETAAEEKVTENA